ncbi:MAG: cell division protein ZapA [Bacteroidales bacterium]|nr:cell division protein ZapA [Bacteroidales bacterium]
MSEKQSIVLKILDRSYSLTIPAENEEIYRNASKRINEMIDKLRHQFPQKDEQDWLRLACLQFELNVLSLDKELQKEELGDSIVKECEELDEFIKINQ